MTENIYTTIGKVRVYETEVEVIINSALYPRYNTEEYRQAILKLLQNEYWSEVRDTYLHSTIAAQTFDRTMRPYITIRDRDIQIEAKGIDTKGISVVNIRLLINNNDSKK